MGYGKKISWSKTYIHLYFQHQLLLPDYNSMSVWYLVT